MLLNWLSRRLTTYLSKQVTQHSVRTSAWEALEKLFSPATFYWWREIRESVWPSST